jgi:putative protease
MSPELELEQARKIISHTDNMETEMFIHGRIPLMVSRFCLIKNIYIRGNADDSECNLCKQRTYAIKDKTDAVFPLRFSGQCNFEILNSKTMCMAFDFDAIKNAGADYLRIDFSYEQEREAIAVINMYDRLLKGDKSALEEYSVLLEKIKKEGFTRGHYFRGTV